MKNFTYVLFLEIVTKQDPFPELDNVQAALGVVTNGLRLQIPEYSPIILAK